jgi:hypothetical protein
VGEGRVRGEDEKGNSYTIKLYIEEHYGQLEKQFL